jgi:hypothetical protein
MDAVLRSAAVFTEKDAFVTRLAQQAERAAGSGMDDGTNLLVKCMLTILFFTNWYYTNRRDDFLGRL